MSALLSANLVHFVRYLRSRGLGVVPQTAQELAAAAVAVGLESRDDVYHAFRAVVVARPADRAVFDEAFELFFGKGRVHADRAVGAPETSLAADQPLRSSLPLFRSATDQSETETWKVEDVIGGSSFERLAKRDFADLSPDEHEAVRRLVSQMVWRPADALSRRWGPSRTGPRPDMRRTFRRLTRPEGDLMPLAYAARRPRRRPLVVIADISGSMERYSEMFLHFVHAAQGRLGRVEAFVFATRLTRITREMRRREPRAALAGVTAAVDDWSGGTRIGEALATFNREWSRRVTRGGAIALMISDGWDTGEPELLSAEMGRLARSVHRLVWLNPLAGRPGYAPETRGMRAAMPHVDDFLAASNILDLVEVVRLLESVPTVRRARQRVRQGAR